MVNIYQNFIKLHRIVINIYQYSPQYWKCFTTFTVFHRISHISNYYISISQYFTVFHIISQYTHQDRLVVRLPTRSLRLSLVQADPDLLAARTRTWNSNLFRNPRFLVGWQLHQPTGQLHSQMARGEI